MVLSRDADLDHAVDMLRAMGRTASRLPGETVANSVAKSTPAGSNGKAKLTSNEKPAEDIYAQHLLKSSRPARRATLINSINACFKHRGGAEPKRIIDALVKRGVISIAANGRISYPDQP